MEHNAQEYMSKADSCHACHVILSSHVDGQGRLNCSTFSTHFPTLEVRNLGSEPNVGLDW